MKTEPSYFKVKDLIDLHKSQMLMANPEYQRGAVWSIVQKKKLIDSVLRGYPLPRIYLHHVSTTVAGMTSNRLEIIDGQQRINALSDFAQGAFKLLDPVEDASVAKFPSFILRQPCPWARCDFDSLADEQKETFLNTEIPVAKIGADNPNEVRDLFVRLQGGVPLSAQERRDALPGNFTEFILRIGGKPELPRYPGHDFFVKSLGMKPNQDRGKARQLAAQIATLFLTRFEKGKDFFCDINAAAIDDFYYQNIDFDRESDAAIRLVAILDKLSQLINHGSHPRFRGHDAIHLILFVDMIWDDYVRSWESNLPYALDKFVMSVSEGNITKKDAAPSEFWLKYSQWTRVNSDRGETIKSRHQFYQEKMFEFVGALTMKDPVRNYGEVERSIAYYRQNKICAVCGSSMGWPEVEIHHVQTHVSGGKTDLSNAAAVHKACHPKSEAQIAAFAQRFCSVDGSE